MIRLPLYGLKTWMDAFWSRVEKGSNCWLWVGTRNDSGYGTVSVNGQQMYTHRIAYEMFNGLIGPDLFVLHRCDTPACVNPHHLFLGTQADNMADMKRKSRASRTVRSSKLSEADVLKVRELLRRGASQEATAKHFSISQTTVSLIHRNRIWKQVQEANSC